MHMPAWCGRCSTAGCGYWPGISGKREKRRLPAGIRPEPMARHIVAAMEGSIMMARLYKREAPLAECVGYLEKMLGIG